MENRTAYALAAPACWKSTGEGNGAADPKRKRSREKQRSTRRLAFT